MQFNSETHEYLNDYGMKVPSVTGVLKDNGFSDFGSVPQDVLEKAGLFGTAYHKATELWDKGTLDITTLSEPLVPLLESYKAFKEQYGIEVIKNEYRGVSKRHFGFCIDKVVKITNGDVKKWINKIAILEIKSGAITESVKYQLGAYRLAWNENASNELEATIKICFKPLTSVQWKLVPYEDENDEVEFLTLLGATLIRMKNKIKRIN